MRIPVHCLSLSPDLMSLAGLRAVVPFSFVVLFRTLHRALQNSLEAFLLDHSHSSQLICC